MKDFGIVEKSFGEFLCIISAPDGLEDSGTKIMLLRVPSNGMFNN